MAGQKSVISRRLAYSLIAAALFIGGIVGGIVGIFTFISIVGGSGEASAPITAPTLSLQTETPNTIGTDTTNLSIAISLLSTQISGLANNDYSSDIMTEIAQINARLDSLMTLEANQQPTAIVIAATATRTPRPTNTPLPTRTPTITPSPSPTALPNQVLFRIVSEESEARYIVDELEPLISGLVGKTDQVAGDIIVDFNNPRNSRIGVIRINIRMLRTGEPARDSTVRGEILLSARPEFEFLDFTPTEIVGLPEKITMGEPITFQVRGILPVRGIERSATFDVTVTPISETELRGLGRTTILRRDYGLMQSALAGHGVSEEVILEIEFVARAVTK